MKLIEFLNHTQVREDVSMTARDYREVRNDPNLFVGFELEFAYVDPTADDFDPDDLWGDSDDAADDYRPVLEELADQFQNVIGQEVIVMTRHEAKETHKWYIELDNSVDDPSESEIGVELVSPPMQIDKTLQDIEACFDEVNSMRDASTNHSTGFHVSMSYKNNEFTQANLNPLKLILLSGEASDLNFFDRLGNSNARQHVEHLKGYIAHNYDFFVKNFNQVDTILKELMSALHIEKHMTFNLRKLQKYGYVEIRIMGGKNYTDRFGSIENRILNYGWLLKAACDPNAYRNAYMKKVYKLLQSGLASTFSPSDHNPSFGDYEKLDQILLNPLGLLKFYQQNPEVLIRLMGQDYFKRLMPFVRSMTKVFHDDPKAAAEFGKIMVTARTRLNSTYGFDDILMFMSEVPTVNLRSMLFALGINEAQFMNYAKQKSRQ